MLGAWGEWGAASMGVKMISKMIRASIFVVGVFLITAGSGCTPGTSQQSGLSETSEVSRAAVNIGSSASPASGGSTTQTETTFDYGDGTGILACPTDEYISGIAVLSKTILTFGAFLDIGVVCSGDGVDFSKVHWALSASQEGATVSTIELASGFYGFSTANYKAGTQALCDLGAFYGPNTGPFEYPSTYAGLALAKCSTSDRSGSTRYNVQSWVDSSVDGLAHDIMVLSQSFDGIGTVVLGFFANDQAGGSFSSSLPIQ